MPERSRVAIFWDNSNIFIPAKYVASRREGLYAERGIRVQFDSLLELARSGRHIVQAVCVGSVPPELATVWERLRRSGISVELYERGKQSGSEQGVDQCLQVHMLRAAVDHPPATAVLLTGDGKGYDDGVGFHADLERLHNLGWGIEVLSWDAACAKRLKAWAGSVGVYQPLDDFYDSITFVEGLRTSEPLSLARRKTVSARSAAQARRS